MGLIFPVTIPPRAMEQDVSNSHQATAQPQCPELPTPAAQRADVKVLKRKIFFKKVSALRGSHVPGAAFSIQAAANTNQLGHLNWRGSA